MAFIDELKEIYKNKRTVLEKEEVYNTLFSDMIYNQFKDVLKSDILRAKSRDIHGVFLLKAENVFVGNIYNDADLDVMESLENELYTIEENGWDAKRTHTYKIRDLVEIYSNDYRLDTRLAVNFTDTGLKVVHDLIERAKSDGINLTFKNICFMAVYSGKVDFLFELKKLNTIETIVNQLDPDSKHSYSSYTDTSHCYIQFEYNYTV